MMEISAQALLVSFYPNANNFFASAIKMYFSLLFSRPDEINPKKADTHLLADTVNR